MYVSCGRTSANMPRKKRILSLDDYICFQESMEQMLSLSRAAPHGPELVAIVTGW